MTCVRNVDVDVALPFTERLMNQELESTHESTMGGESFNKILLHIIVYCLLFT